MLAVFTPANRCVGLWVREQEQPFIDPLQVPQDDPLTHNARQTRRMQHRKIRIAAWLWTQRQRICYTRAIVHATKCLQPPI